MLRVIWSQLRRRSGRAAALFAGILAATTGFTVLTGSVTTSKLHVGQEIDANFRAAYDILVRPPGARSSIEDERGLVRPNYLSGQFGGITMDQWERIKRVDGVDIAAPIAMLGYAPYWRYEEVDLTDLVDRSLDQQIIELTPTFVADRGLTKAADTPMYVYVTKHELIYADLRGSGLYYPDGRRAADDCSGPLERLPSGQTTAICGTLAADPTEESRRMWFSWARLLPNGEFGFKDGSRPRLVLPFAWIDVVGAAAIDPDQESRLVGLDKVVSAGRYLGPDDHFIVEDQLDPGGQKFQRRRLPVLASTTVFADSRFTLGARRLTPDVARAVPGTKPEKLIPALRQATGTAAGQVSQKSDVEDPLSHAFIAFNTLFQGGLPTYDEGPDGALIPRVVPNDLTVWNRLLVSAVNGNTPPIFAWDTALRTLDTVDTRAEGLVDGRIVGELDLARLAGFSTAEALPLETYQSPELPGADAATRSLLGGEPLRSNSNVAGYLSRPPLLITTLDAAATLLEKTSQGRAPISAVRVRVSNVERFDALTRERIRKVAEDIALTTGLDVDITVGSSPSPQTIRLPAGQFGRPELQLSERWSRKGVAVAIVAAIDRKSGILFGLILAVCVLFLSNALIAAVRFRQRELAVLACLGWPRLRLAQLILAEVGGLGLLAGACAAALAWPLAAATGVTISPGHALLAIPVAFGLSLFAAALPAWRASRSHPGAMVASYGVAGKRRRWGRPRTVLGLAVRNALRIRGRTAVGVLAMAFGVGAFTLVAALQWAFHGAVTGTLLGEAVSVRVRGVDTVAVVTTLLLAAAAVADALYLNVRERAAELATLRATGWSDLAVARLVGYEGVLIGLIGAGLGAGIGLYGVNLFTGAVTPPVLAACATAAAIGAVLAAVAAAVPAWLVRRLPMPALLAEE